MALKELVRGISKFFTSQKVVLLLVFLVVAFLLMYYSGSSSKRVSFMGASEGMSNYDAPSALAPSDLSETNHIMIPSVGAADGASPVQSSSGDYTALESADPADLLPNDVNNAWSQLNPTSQGDIRNPDLLQAGYLIGLDTIGQTLRIPNYQLRADPIIPKQNVGPWNQAPDVDPDYGRVPLDAGCSN